MMSRTLLLIRHGQSEFNAQNRFTGLTDVRLTPTGAEQSQQLGERLADQGLSPAVIFTSDLRRTIQSGLLIKMVTGGVADLVTSAALNERDYGELTGLDKDAARRRWGEAQVRRWRRSFREAPPRGESLRDTVARVAPYFVREILPRILEEDVVAVVGHGNSLRALAFTLEGLSETAVADLEFETGQATAYRFGGTGRVTNKFALTS